MARRHLVGLGSTRRHHPSRRRRRPVRARARGRRAVGARLPARRCAAGGVHERPATGPGRRGRSGRGRRPPLVRGTPQRHGRHARRTCIRRRVRRSLRPELTSNPDGDARARRRRGRSRRRLSERDHHHARRDDVAPGRDLRRLHHRVRGRGRRHAVRGGRRGPSCRKAPIPTGCASTPTATSGSRRTSPASSSTCGQAVRCSIASRSPDGGPCRAVSVATTAAACCFAPRRRRRTTTSPVAPSAIST